MKNLILALLMISTTTLIGQKLTGSVIYLHNGSIVKGQMIEKNDSTLAIELLGGSRFVFQLVEIDSISVESLRKKQLIEIRRNYYRRDKGFRNITELSMFFGSRFKNQPEVYYQQSQDDWGLSLHTINGYQFWPYLFAGAGVGIDRFISYEQTFSPFYLRVSSEILKRKVTPYFWGDVGYSVMWKQPETEYVTYKNKGGLYVQAGGGVRIYTRARASVMLGLAYRRNSSETKWWYTGWDNGTYYTIKRNYQRLAMSVGVTF